MPWKRTGRGRSRGGRCGAPGCRRRRMPAAAPRPAAPRRPTPDTTNRRTRTARGSPSPPLLGDASASPKTDAAASKRKREGIGNWGPRDLCARCRALGAKLPLAFLPSRPGVLFSWRQRRGEKKAEKLGDHFVWKHYLIKVGDYLRVSKKFAPICMSLCKLFFTCLPFLTDLELTVSIC